MSDRSKRRPVLAETILVVEPDVLVRMVISDYLRECGYKVIEAVSSREAMAILGSDRKIDAVFAEVKLEEGMDGFALAQWVRTNHPRVGVVLTSGPDSAANKAGDLCEEGPMDKPYHPDQVARRLKILFAKRREREQRS
jgi:CheY-like chemotaxis protein